MRPAGAGTCEQPRKTTFLSHGSFSIHDGGERPCEQPEEQTDGNHRERLRSPPAGIACSRHCEQVGVGRVPPPGPPPLLAAEPPASADSLPKPSSWWSGFRLEKRQYSLTRCRQWGYFCRPPFGEIRRKSRTRPHVPGSGDSRPGFCICSGFRQIDPGKNQPPKTAADPEENATSG